VPSQEAQPFCGQPLDPHTNSRILNGDFSPGAAHSLRARTALTLLLLVFESVMKNCCWILLACLAVVVSGCRKDDGKITVAFVTNGIDPFWDIAEKGARDAAADPKIDVNVEVVQPKSLEDQQVRVREMLAKGVKGIAISPINPDNQGDLLDEIASHTKLITQDTDAPASKRLCYVGMDNYEAGRMCGKLVKKALPDGGKLMLFVGRLTQENAKLRRMGLMDEVLGRERDPKRVDDPDTALTSKDGKYTIQKTWIDQFDRVKAKDYAKLAIGTTPDLKCMVGLFAYNPPKCLDAIRTEGKLGQIKVVAFDEHPETLQGIKDGHIEGTVAQNPYMYGFESVKILAALARNDQSVLPKGGIVDFPARTITAANVGEFWAELRQRVGKWE
jgi:ribose transport system substrate-binding protein